MSRSQLRKEKRKEPFRAERRVWARYVLWTELAPVGTGMEAEAGGAGSQLRMR